MEGQEEDEDQRMGRNRNWAAKLGCLMRQSLPTPGAQQTTKIIGSGYPNQVRPRALVSLPVTRRCGALATLPGRFAAWESRRHLAALSPVW